MLLKGAGVREVRLHDARHTAATLLLLQSVDIRTVMSIMGWTEMATAQRARWASCCGSRACANRAMVSFRRRSVILNSDKN